MSRAVAAWPDTWVLPAPLQGGCSDLPEPTCCATPPHQASCPQPRSRQPFRGAPRALWAKGKPGLLGPWGWGEGRGRREPAMSAPVARSWARPLGRAAGEGGVRAPTTTHRALAGAGLEWRLPLTPGLARLRSGWAARHTLDSRLGRQSSFRGAPRASQNTSPPFPPPPSSRPLVPPGPRVATSLTSDSRISHPFCVRVSLASFIAISLPLPQPQPHSIGRCAGHESDPR